jgi:hypothetical protein
MNYIKIAVASNQNALLYIKNRTQELLDIVKSRNPYSKWTLEYDYNVARQLQLNYNRII